jgi:putative oxidoreductase
MNKRQIALEAIASLLILLFLYASISKFLDFQRFTGEMNNQPLPNSWTPFLVWALPSLEIIIALVLILEKTRMIGLIGALILMTVFTLYTAVILLHFFAYVPCSCGGVIRKLSWPQHLVFNLFFVGLSVIGIILQRKRFLVSNFITNNSFV